MASYRVPMWVVLTTSIVIVVLLISHLFVNDSIKSLGPVRSSWLGSKYGNGGSATEMEGCNWAVNAESSECKMLSKKYLGVYSSWHIGTPPSPTCNIMAAGTGWGQHNLCEFSAPKTVGDCAFVSFGISSDWSFDSFLAINKSCKGVGLDPSVNHKGYLVEQGGKVRFLPIGATVLDYEDEYNHEWQQTSVPRLLRFLKWNRLQVLKMDCEGCEYSLARDVAREDPSFFDKVDQLAIEFHTSTAWIKTWRHAHYMGLLFAQLHNAGLTFQEYARGGCSGADEAKGCPKELLDAGYPCKGGTLCSSYLFARAY
ncbi:hypothetical protein HDV05_004875 [Chytridiales sp. JEL 0842]|nr:hypothetical protein HDV05_004875 [Chytridiales sp. JEL 0842]